MNPQAVGVWMCAWGMKHETSEWDINIHVTCVFLTSSSRRACLFFLLAWSCLCSSCSASSLRCSLLCCSNSSSSSSSSCSRVCRVQETEQMLLNLTSHLWWITIIPGGGGSYLTRHLAFWGKQKEKLPAIFILAHTANSIYKSNVWVKTLGTYKFRLISLNDITVVPLVLLHSQLGVLHIDVVRQVKHCVKKTQSKTLMGQ